MPFEDQPTFLVRAVAKPGMADELIRLATEGMEKSGASDRWLIIRSAEDPNVFWNIETFRSEEALAEYEKEGGLSEELRAPIWDMMAEATKVRVNIYSAKP